MLKYLLNEHLKLVPPTSGFKPCFYLVIALLTQLEFYFFNTTVSSESSPLIFLVPSRHHGTGVFLHTDCLLKE